MVQSEKITLFIDMMPPSANRIWLQNYKTGKTYLNPKYRDFKKFVALTLAGKKLPSSWPYCYVKIVVHPRRRAGDADNYTKPTLDALTAAGFWVDDKVVADVRARFGSPDKKGGCLLITIERREKKYTDEEEE